MTSLEQLPLRDIVDWLTSATMVPFLGAGASRAGVPAEDQLPAGRELADELFEHMDSPSDLADGPLAKVAQYYEVQTDRSALYQFLRNRFYEGQRATLIGSTARLLAEQLGVGGSKRPIVVTTNYDNQMERALIEAGRPHVVLTHEFGRISGRLLVTSAEGGVEVSNGRDFVLSDYVAGTVFVYKIHGTLDWPEDKPRNTVIITEDDYVDFLLNSRPAHIPPSALVREFLERRFLFLGYSLQDWNFRVMLRLISQLAEGPKGSSAQLGPMRHFAVDRGVTPVDRELWVHRGVRMFAVDLVEFVDSFRRIVSEKERRQARPPGEMLSRFSSGQSK